MSARQDLQTLRGLLAPLVESFELDDLDRGLVAWVPVVGGTFVHPLTRQPIPRLQVYGAGADRIKILQPRFMRTLPTIPVVGLQHASQLCATVARVLGEALGELGRIRKAVAAMGIGMDLDHDVLQLRGQLELQGIRVELLTARPGQLIVSALGSHPVTAIDLDQRSLSLTGQSTSDLDELARLIRRLDDQIRREALEQMERNLGLLGDEPDAPAAVVSPPASFGPAPGFGGGWGDLLPEPQPEPQAEQQPTAQAESTAQDQLELLEPEPLSSELDPAGVQAATAPAARFVQGVSDVVELVDLLEEEPEVPQPEAPRPEVEPAAVRPAPPQEAAAPQASTPEVRALEARPAEGLPAVRIDTLFEVAGSDTEISANEGRLRLKIPFRVVQGQFHFYLEQVGAKRFNGFLVSPTGARYKVDVDFGSVMDIKEVFDRIMLGR